MIVLQALHGVSGQILIINEKSKDRFKYFSDATSNDLLFYIEPTLGESQFDTAIINVGINDLLNNTTGTEVLLQNILKTAARCKMSGIDKIFVLSKYTQSFKWFDSEF